jgi:hypothetical protein
MERGGRQGPAIATSTPPLRQAPLACSDWWRISLEAAPFFRAPKVWGAVELWICLKMLRDWLAFWGGRRYGHYSFYVTCLLRASNRCRCLHPEH